MKIHWPAVAAALLLLAGPGAAATPEGPDKESLAPVVRTAEQWKALLSPWQFHVLREEGTDIAFTGNIWNNHRKGIYRCSGCGLGLFGSETKFDSGTGWPSFWQPLRESHIRKAVTDPEAWQGYSELKCARCGGHLGHVFDDGPRPTGLRYCIDGSALKFEPRK